MILYLRKVRDLLKKFVLVQVKHVPRAENSKADALAKLATAPQENLGRSTLVEYLAEPSIDLCDVVVTPVESEPSWMDPIRSSSISRKSLEAEILLAYNTQRCNRPSQEMQNMPGARHPSEPLTSITSPWPFQQWGLDILGPLAIGKGQCKFIIVAVDYFTKWAEAEPLASITEQKIRNFMWRAVI